MSYRQNFSRIVPAAISFLIAAFCVLALALMIYDRWSRPEVRNPDQANQTTTGTATRNAGAKLQPTDPKLSVEPSPAGPNPVQPANPN